MAKKILYQDNARRALERGMEIMVEAVSVTLGPKGRNVVLEKAYGSPEYKTAFISHRRITWRNAGHGMECQIP